MDDYYPFLFLRGVFEYSLLRSAILHTSEGVVLGLRHASMVYLVLTGGVCWQKEGDMSSLPLLHPTCCELTQPGHTGPSRTAVTGEMTTLNTGCVTQALTAFLNSWLSADQYSVEIIRASNVIPCYQK